MRDCFLAAGLPVVLSNDEVGNCGTTLYLTFKNVEEAKNKLQKINTDKTIAIPISARPAHVCWQWMHLIAEVRPQYKYHKSLFLNSIDLISRTIKFDTPFDMNIDDIEDYAKKIINRIKS
jgi:hypothetical protein